METITKKSWLKVAGLVLAFSSFAFVANAQRTSTADAPTGAGDFAKKANATPGKFDGSVRVIDNKGTIKYIQAANGLTTITNTTANVTTTTWQLGGTLTDDTYIDATGKEFGIKGLAEGALTGAATAFGGTGWTLVVRDETTGQMKKVLASDLLQVQSGQTVVTVGATESTDVITAANPKITPTGGAPLPSDHSKVSVYRNGVKLVANSDYTVASGAVTLVPTNTAYGDWALYEGDVVEVHWFK